MAEHDLLSFDDNMPNWPPLQHTSTPRGEEWQPLTSNLQGGAQFLNNPDPTMEHPLMGDPMMGGVPGISPERWMQHLSAEQQAKREHELKMLEMQLEAQTQELRAQREQQEFELQRLKLQSEHNSSLHTFSGSNAKFKDIKVKPLEASDDIDVYLSAFERLSEANKWPKPEWATRLAAALTGKAREAFTRMPIDESGDYNKLKEAILLAYNFTPEAYRHKLRSVQKSNGETHRQFSVRVRTLMERWISGENVSDFDDFQDLLIREQMLESYYPNLQIYLKDRNPKSVQQLAELAEHYEQVHQKDHNHKPFGRHYGNGPQTKSHGERKESSNDDKKKYKDSKKGSGPKCWKCNQLGHVQRECKQALRADCGKALKRIYGTVNSRPVSLLTDSGADVTLVHSQFVAPSNYIAEETMDIRQIDGSTVKFPLAEVNIVCNMYSGNMLVGVLDTLPEDVVLAVEAVPTAVMIPRRGP
jgi:hypothetical protein